MNDFTGRVRRDEWRPPVGLRRTITCALDTAQYQLDMDSLAQHRGEDLYATFNLLMRRKPKVSPPLSHVCDRALCLPLQYHWVTLRATLSYCAAI